jgi:hypothetical protein
MDMEQDSLADRHPLIAATVTSLLVAAVRFSHVDLHWSLETARAALLIVLPLGLVLGALHRGKSMPPEAAREAVRGALTSGLMVALTVGMLR